MSATDGAVTSSTYAMPGALFGISAIGLAATPAQLSPANGPATSDINAAGVKGGNTTAAAISYAQTAVKGGPWTNPTFWLIALFALSIIMLAHIAHVEIRE
jgi:hypothetical protein